MADEITDNLGLTKPEPGVVDPAQTWDEKLDENFELIDDLLDEETPSTQNFGDSANPGTSTKVARADHKHGMPSGMPYPVNLLTNGGFEVWQRGDSFSSPADGAYTADKWQIVKAGGTPPTFTVDKESTQIDSGSLYSMKLSCSNAGASLTKGLYLEQDMGEFRKRFQFAGCSVSVRVKTTIANKVTLKIVDTDGSGESAAHTGSGEWETLTVSRVMGTTNQMLIQVGMIDTSDVAVGDVYIDNAMMVGGGASTAAFDFVPLPPGIEMARCFRYYQKIKTGIRAIGRSDGTNYVLGTTVRIVPMPGSAAILSDDMTLVEEEGATSDQKASYTLTTALANYVGGATEDWTELQWNVSKAIAGSKPSRAEVEIILEDA